jgi:cell division protein FtsL
MSAARTPATQRFVLLWILASAAVVAALSVPLAVRVRCLELGYALGQAQTRLGRLREVKRVLELELASYESAPRVRSVARSLLGMEAPSPGRILQGPPLYGVPDSPAVTPKEAARPERLQ